MATPSYDEELAFINNLIGQAECYTLKYREAYRQKQAAAAK